MRPSGCVATSIPAATCTWCWAFLGEFSIAAGKRGGEFCTPNGIVSLIVEMLRPCQGRVYDPCCGSGGFFVQSERFVEEHGGKVGQISIHGQAANPTTWRRASMNMAIRGLDLDFGKEPASTDTAPGTPTCARTSSRPTGPST